MKNKDKSTDIQKKLTKDYGQATMLIANQFLKEGISVTLENPREDDWSPAETRGISINNDLHILVSEQEHRGGERKNSYDIALSGHSKSYGHIMIDEWEMKLDDDNSIKETINKTQGIIKNMSDVKEFGGQTTELISSVMLVPKEQEKDKELER